MAVDEFVPLIRDVYHVPREFKSNLILSLFSLLTKKPGSLSSLQRIPHYDSTRTFYFASVHYLSPREFAGTGIFRHRPTGFERISDHRVHAYVSSAKAFMAKHGESEAAYIKQSTEHFELIQEISYKPNRFVLYPGNLLHSGLVDPLRDINDDPVKGRLTANLFLNFDRH